MNKINILVWLVGWCIPFFFFCCMTATHTDTPFFLLLSLQLFDQILRANLIILLLFTVNEGKRKRKKRTNSQFPFIKQNKKGKVKSGLVLFFFLFVCFTPFYMSVCSSACIFHNPQYPSHYTFVVSIVKIQYSFTLLTFHPKHT